VAGVRSLPYPALLIPNRDDGADSLRFHGPASLRAGLPACPGPCIPDYRVEAGPRKYLFHGRACGFCDVGVRRGASLPSLTTRAFERGTGHPMTKCPGQKHACLHAGPGERLRAGSPACRLAGVGPRLVPGGLSRGRSRDLTAKRQGRFRPSHDSCYSSAGLPACRAARRPAQQRPRLRDTDVWGCEHSGSTILPRTSGLGPLPSRGVHNPPPPNARTVTPSMITVSGSSLPSRFRAATECRWQSERPGRTPATTGRSSR
jgi:hypothetical protein